MPMSPGVLIAQARCSQTCLHIMQPTQLPGPSQQLTGGGCGAHQNEVCAADLGYGCQTISEKGIVDNYRKASYRGNDFGILAIGFVCFAFTSIIQLGNVPETAAHVVQTAAQEMHDGQKLISDHNGLCLKHQSEA